MNAKILTEDFYRYHAITPTKYHLHGLDVRCSLPLSFKMHRDYFVRPLTPPFSVPEPPPSHFQRQEPGFFWLDGVTFSTSEVLLLNVCFVLSDFPMFRPRIHKRASYRCLREGRRGEQHPSFPSCLSFFAIL